MTKMNRRAFFAPGRTASTNALRPPTLAVTGLNPYTGTFGRQEAGHLLGRATFGASYAQLQEAADLGLEATLDQLLADLPLPPAPLITSLFDGGGAIGETWVDKPYAAGDNLMRSVVTRIRSLFGYIGRNTLTEGMHLGQTMTLFWHNHFAINTAVEPKYNYRYLTTIQTHKFGDFRQLVKDMTIDPLMLTFLNGNQNTVAAPNENYARELLELFTIGKGPQVGDGDYTNYTEQDVVAMAKSLTGWRDFGFNATNTGDFGSVFRPNRHDSSTVQLSHRFNNVEFPSSGENTYADLVDLILEQDEVARFIVRKLYRWFVYYEISEQVETEVIAPLADLFRDGDYVIEPVLRALLGSEHFFDVLSQGPMIKHPMDYTLGLLRTLEVKQEGNERQLQSLYVAVSGFSREIGMTYFTPPNVAGWKAFYQEPLYYRHWINSATLPLRQQMSARLINGQADVQGYGTLEVSLLDVVRQFPQPEQLYPMLDEWLLLLLPRPVPAAQREHLRNVLLPGLPEDQWLVEYVELLENPSDENLEQAIERKLRRMVLAITEFPEFQLS